MNNNNSCIEPCGTPFMTVDHFKAILLTTVLWTLHEGQFAIKSATFSSVLSDCIFDKSFSGPVVV